MSRPRGALAIAVSKSACGRLGPVIRHQRLAVDSCVAAATAALDQQLAGRAAAHRNKYLVLLGRWRRAWRSHQAGIGDLRGDRCGERKAVAERREGRVAMHHHQVEMAVDDLDRLFVAAGLHPLLQYVAHRGDQRRLGCHRSDGVEQRQQLEAHLPPAERIGLDHHDVRPDFGEGREQHVAAARFVSVVDRLARRVGQFGKSLVGSGDRSAASRSRPPAPEIPEPPCRLSRRLPQTRLRRARPATRLARATWPMPEQMLDIEENARAAHGEVCHSRSNRPVSWRMLLW